MRELPLLESQDVSACGLGSLTFRQAVDVIRASGHFDDSHYVACYAAMDPIIRLVDPISHYLSIGYRRGYRPSPEFDAVAYLKAHPLVQASGLNPLMHLAQVMGQGAVVPRRAVPNVASVNATLPSKMDRLTSSNPRGSVSKPELDVIIPVFGGRQETLQAIASVLRSKNATPHEIVVIDDDTPDRDLSTTLQSLAKSGEITLIRNSTNLGFVKSVNKALALHKTRDAILLNSDVLVFGNWIDRLRRHAGAGVATVTPFSNNAALCSYPRIFEENTRFAVRDAQRTDRLTSVINRGRAVEVPTGVGFCMHVSRDAIKAAGDLDAEAFGEGYGEEWDFSLRAARLGFRNLQALDLFVYHRGAVSFGDRSARLKDSARTLIVGRYPDYEARVRAFALADPSLEARQRLDMARLFRAGTGRKRLRFVSDPSSQAPEHSWPQSKDCLSDIVLAQADPGGRSISIHALDGSVDTPSLRGIDCQIGGRLEQLLKVARISALEVFDASGGRQGCALNLIVLARQLGIPSYVFAPVGSDEGKPS